MEPEDTMRRAHSMWNLSVSDSENSQRLSVSQLVTRFQSIHDLRSADTEQEERLASPVTLPSNKMEYLRQLFECRGPKGGALAQRKYKSMENLSQIRTMSPDIRNLRSIFEKPCALSQGPPPAFPQPRAGTPGPEREGHQTPKTPPPRVKATDGDGLDDAPPKPDQQVVKEGLSSQTVTPERGQRPTPLPRKSISSSTANNRRELGALEPRSSGTEQSASAEQPPTSVSERSAVYQSKIPGAGILGCPAKAVVSSPEIVAPNRSLHQIESPATDLLNSHQSPAQSVNQLTADKPRTLSSFQCIICHSNLSLNGYASMKGDFYCIPHFQQLLKSEGFHGEEFKPEQKSNGPLEGDGADPKAQVEESRGQLSRTTNVGETSQRDVILSPAHTSKLDLEPSGKSGSPRKLKITWPPPKEAQRDCRPNRNVDNTQSLLPAPVNASELDQSQPFEDNPKEFERKEHFVTSDHIPLGSSVKQGNEDINGKPEHTMRELRSSPQARGDNKDHPSIKELTRVFELGDSGRSIGKNVKQERATETEGDLKGSKEKPSVSSQLKTDELAQSLKELSEIFESNASGEVSGKEANCEDPVKNEDKLHLASGPEVRAEQQDLSERRQSFELSDEDRPNEGTAVVDTKPGESPEELRDKSIEESLDDGTSCEDRGSLEESLLTTPALSPSTLPSSDSQATSVLSSPHSSEGKDESMSNCDTNSPSEQTDTSASSASLAVQDPVENGQDCIKSTTKGMGEFGETSIEIGQEDEDRLTASQDTSDVAEEALVRDIGVAMSASSSEDYNSCLDSDISEEMSTVLEDSDEADRDQLQSLDVSHREDEKGIAAETLQIERKETETDENSEVSRANQDGVIADEPAENKEDIKTENPSLNIGEQDTKEQVALDPEVDKTFNSEVDKMMDMTLNPKMAIKNSSNKTTLAKETAKAKGPSKSPLAKLFGFSDSGNAKKTTAEQLKPHKPNSQSASNLEKTQEQKVSDPEKSQEQITSDLEKSQEKIISKVEKFQKQGASDSKKTSKEPEVKEDGSEDLLVRSGSQTSSEHSTEASLNTSLTELPIEPTKTTTEQTQPNSVMGKMAGTNAVESRPAGGNVASDVTDLFDPLSQDPNPGTEPSQQPNSSPNSADLLDFEDRG